MEISQCPDFISGWALASDGAQGKGANLKIRVTLTSVFREALESGELSIALSREEAHVRSLLRRVAALRPERLDRLLYEPGGEKIVPGMMVRINERLLTGSDLNRRNVTLFDGDHVVLLYFVSGG